MEGAFLLYQDEDLPPVKSVRHRNNHKKMDRNHHASRPSQRLLLLDTPRMSQDNLDEGEGELKQQHRRRRRQTSTTETTAGSSLWSWAGSVGPMTNDQASTSSSLSRQQHHPSTTLPLTNRQTTNTSTLQQPRGRVDGSSSSGGAGGGNSATSSGNHTPRRNNHSAGPAAPLEDDVSEVTVDTAIRHHHHHHHHYLDPNAHQSNNNNNQGQYPPQPPAPPSNHNSSSNYWMEQMASLKLELANIKADHDRLHWKCQRLQQHKESCETTIQALREENKCLHKTLKDMERTYYRQTMESTTTHPTNSAKKKNVGNHHHHHRGHENSKDDDDDKDTSKNVDGHGKDHVEEEEEDGRVSLGWSHSSGHSTVKTPNHGNHHHSPRPVASEPTTTITGIPLIAQDNDVDNVEEEEEEREQGATNTTTTNLLLSTNPTNSHCYFNHNDASLVDIDVNLDDDVASQAAMQRKASVRRREKYPANDPFATLNDDDDDEESSSQDKLHHTKPTGMQQPRPSSSSWWSGWR